LGNPEGLEKFTKTARKTILRERLQIHARTKAAPGARQNAGGQPLVCVELFDGCEQALRESGVHRISRVGSIQRNQ